MNEIALLREHGPDPVPPSEPALAAARSRLMAEIAGTAARRPGRWARPGRPAWTPRTRLLSLAAVAAIAAAAVAVIGAPPDPPPPAVRPPAGVSLVSFTAPVFPLALDPRPAGLTDPVFSGEPDHFIAVYLAGDGGNDDVYLGVWSQDDPRAHDARARAITIDGRPGELTETPQETGSPSVTVRWQRKPGQWVSVTGNGRLATEATVRALAAALVDRPQEVPLRVGLAPAGWELRFFKDNTILTLGDAGSDDSTRTMSVQLVAGLESDLMGWVQGAVEEQPVRVNGRAARLVRTEEIWFLQAPLPDGTAFNLQAPLSFTPDQVIAIGAQVTVRR
ncbi:hypothetical protein [Micromonospora sp. NPDC005189]|uniref:hypothetical protein n=1 Tax=unclassified Micromonospora TaxID=2617518 RepID=UPI0033A0CD70